MGTYRITNAITKSVLLQCASCMEQALVPLFQKEGWDIFRLGKEQKEFHGVASYDCTSNHEKIKQVFSVHHFDLVVYDLRKNLGMQSVLYLEELLQLAAFQHSGKIVLLSGAAVFSDNQICATETMATQPASKEGRYLARLEALALSWKKQGLAVTILRFPDIYGVEMGWKDNFVSRYLYACARKENVPTYKAEEQREFLSVRDAAYAIFQTYERGYTGDYLHIAPNQALTYKDFFQMVRATIHGEIAVDSQQQGQFAQALLRPDLAQQQIGWQARHSLSEDLPTIYTDITQTLMRENKLRQQKRCKRRIKEWKNKVIPYVENAVGAAVMLGIMKLQNGQPVNPTVPFDFNFLYISIMGLVYGRRQAFLAVFCSYILLILSNFGQFGVGLIAILYQPEKMLHFLSYLVIGVLTGYVADQSKFRNEAARWQHLHDLGQYRFLRRLFEENVKIKDKMYRQIVNSKDSMGRMYHIISSLDSVEPEKIYNKTALVTAEILDVSQVIIYVVGKNAAYLRQKVRIGDRTEHEPHSLKVTEYPYLQQMMRDRRIFINRDLMKNVPDLAAPIIYEGKVIAVIQIYQMDFNKWSIYEMNLMAITSRLVSSSLARAYSWEQEMMRQRYVPDTQILKETEFIRVIEKIRERCQMQTGYSVMLAKVNLPGMTYEQIDRRIGSQIRAEDYTGILDQSVWMLFPDVDRTVWKSIRERLAQHGIPTSDFKEVK